MSFTLILRRELGAQARHASSYWLRVCGALLVSIVFAVLAVQEQEPAPVFGARLLATLHSAGSHAPHRLFDCRGQELDSPAYSTLYAFDVGFGPSGSSPWAMDGANAGRTRGALRTDVSPSGR